MASKFRQHLLLIEISIFSHEAPLAALVTISLKNNRQLFVECRFFVCRWIHVRNAYMTLLTYRSSVCD